MSRTTKAALLCGLIAVATPRAASAMPWSWDMFSQPSHKAQEETALPVPKDSVPIGGKPAFGVKTKEKSLNLPNPVPPTEESFVRGEALYKIYCAICHGDTGH
ncbi:MAG: cytochrome c, partial [Deltaproteobacteria bacterium]